MAQPVLTLTIPAPLTAGVGGTVTVTLTGSAGTNLAAIGFTLPAVAINPAAGPASTTAGKSLLTNASNAVLIGMTGGQGSYTYNANLYGDGVVATFNYPPPAAAVGTQALLSLLNVLGVDNAGNAVAVTSPPFTPGVNASPCQTDIQTALTAYLAAPTQALLGLLEADLSAVLNGGVCK